MKDHNYFNAIYLSELSSILFKIATNPPDFAHDETADTITFVPSTHIRVPSITIGNGALILSSPIYGDEPKNYIYN